MDSGLSKRQLYWMRTNALYNERTSFFNHWRELSRFLLPRAGRFIEQGDRNRGDKRYGDIYDNTATRALRTLAAGLMAGMTSPARPWFRLATRDKGLMESANVKEWLDDVTEIMRDVFNVSNTYRALHAIYQEIGAFGTGATIIQEDYNDVIRHYPLTVGEYALAANDRGEVDTLVRKYELTVAQIVKQFVKPSPTSKSGTPDWSVVSPMVKNLYDGGKGLDTWIPVVHIIEPREDRDPKLKDSKNMAFASCIFEQGTQEDRFLRESGFKRFPVLAPRWECQSSDVYATSCPGMEALGDVKQLQHGQLRKAQAIDFMVKPPIILPSSSKAHETDFAPGGVSFVDMAGANSAVKSAWDVKIDLNGQLEDIKDVRERINETFYKPLFLMMESQDSQQPITAREVAEKHEEKLLMLGPVLERLHNELLKQKIDITFDKMVAAGIIPPPPQEMHGQELQVEFVSMLAQAQKAIGAQAVDRYVMSMGQIAQFQPSVLDNFDTDKWAEKYADMTGVDPDLIVSGDKVAIIRQQRSEQQAAQAKAAQAQQMAETAKTASQADTSGKNGLTDVMQGLTGYSTPGPQ